MVNKKQFYFQPILLVVQLTDETSFLARINAISSLHCKPPLNVHMNEYQFCKLGLFSENHNTMA